MSELKKGDTVQLKSGGPLMTVSDLGNYGGAFGTGPEAGARCVWFDAKHQMQEQIFDVAVLKKA